MKRVLLAICAVFILSNIQGQITGLELLGKRNKVTVPFEYSQGFILVDIGFARTLPLTFLFDTGAEHSLLFKKELSDILGIRYSRKVQVLGADLSRELYAFIARNINISLTNCHEVKRDILVLEENIYKLDQLVGLQIDGILGGSFFKELVVTIDYKKQVLVLEKPQGFKPPQKNFIDFDVEIRRSKPYLRTDVQLLDSTTLNVKLLIDSGAAIPFLLHTNTSPTLHMPERIITGNLGMGLGGTIEGYLGKVRYLKMKDFEFRNLLTSFQDLNLELYSDSLIFRNGLLGNKILDRFKVIIDYHRSKVYFTAYKNAFGKDFVYDKSGLILIAVGPELNDYFVKDVIDDSPAEDAGFKKGDRVKRIGILSSRWYTLERILKKLRGKTGKKINIVVERNGVKIKKSLILRDLFELASGSNN